MRQALWLATATAATPTTQVLAALPPLLVNNSLYPQQTGFTLVGSPAYEWHQVVIENDLTNVTWRVDGLLIATVPTAADTAAAAGNIFLAIPIRTPGRRPTSTMSTCCLR